MFWTIFWPVFSALFSLFVLTEVYHLALGFYLHKRQEKARLEFEAKVARGEIDPMQMLFGSSYPGMDYPVPTVSGEKAKGPELSHGQYL